MLPPCHCASSIRRSNLRCRATASAPNSSSIMPPHDADTACHHPELTAAQYWMLEDSAYIRWSDNSHPCHQNSHDTDSHRTTQYEHFSHNESNNRNADKSYLFLL